MSGDVTEQALARLSHLPDSDNPADLIAAQKYYDVEFTGGAISNVTLTDCTINGSETARQETIVTDPGDYTVQAGDYVITINKASSQITTVTLPASPTTSRSLIIKDGKGDAASYNITINGNGKTIDGQSTIVINLAYGSKEIIYNGTEWNGIGEYAPIEPVGDVVGPGTATDNAIPRYDGTTGKLIQNSVVTIADTTGQIAGTQSVLFSCTGVGTTELRPNTSTANNTVILPTTSTTLVGNNTSDTLTNKTISGASNTISNINLASQVTGNLPVTNLNGGLNASASTVWRGDGTWAPINAGGDVVGPGSSLRRRSPSESASSRPSG